MDHGLEPLVFSIYAIHNKDHAIDFDNDNDIDLKILMTLMLALII